MKKIKIYKQLGLVLILIATTTFLLYLSIHKDEHIVQQSNQIIIDSISSVNSDETRTIKQVYTVHSPILIESDDDLTVFPGSGTKDDPYIIENFNITDSTANGIKIYGTTKYIVIRDCFLDGGGLSSSFYGIYIDSTTDGTITVTNNTISNYATGIYLSSCSNNSFTFNIITDSNNDGLYLSSSSNNTFSSNTITNSDDDGITISFSSGNTLTFNNITNNNGEGIYFSFSSNNNLASNIIAENINYAIDLYSSSSNSFVKNLFIKNNQGGSSQASDSGTINKFYTDITGNYWYDWNGTGIYAIDGSANNFDPYPMHVDLDRDGMPDKWEEDNGLNTNINDSAEDLDSDGLTNLEEYTSNTNPNYSDTDSDGLSDGEEVHTYFTDPLDFDTDDDGLLDGEEVKTYSSNPNNPDTDSDGMPDGWEVNYGLNPSNDDSTEDFDGDGLSNVAEYSHNTDPTNPDTDNDGLFDGQEINTYGTDPTNPDTDGDGLSDGEEVDVYGTDPLNPDTDNDGVSDGEEVSKGKNPKGSSLFAYLFSSLASSIITITVLVLVITIIIASIVDIMKKKKNKQMDETKKQKITKITKKKKIGLKFFNEKIDSLENEWSWVEREQKSGQSLFDTAFSEKISELFVELIETLIGFNYAFTKDVKYLTNLDWLSAKKRLNSLLDQFRALLLKELEEIDIDTKFEEINNELTKITLENIEKPSEDKLLQPFDVLLDTLVKIDKNIRKTESFIDEFTFSKLTSYWGKLSDIIVTVKSEVENKRSEVRKNIKEVKEVFTDKRMNLERLETLNKVVSVYKQISLSKLAYLLKFSSNSALIYWMSKQNLDFSYRIVDDEIIFEKQEEGEKEEGKEEIEYDSEVADAIDSLLRQYDEWSKGDEGKKI